MKKIIFFILLLSIWISTDFKSAYAEDILQIHIIQSTPVGFKDSKGNMTGYHWDYLSAIEKKSGIPMEKILMPYARIWKSLKDGGHDGGIVFRSHDRDDFVEYVAPVATRKNIVISRKGIYLKTYEDLYTLKSIAIIQDAQIGERFNADPKIQKLFEIVYDYDTMVRMIARGRVDAMVGSVISLSYLLKELNVTDKVELTGFEIGTREEWLQFSKKSKHLDKIPMLAKAIDELRAEGVFDELLEKYIGKDLIKIIK